MIARVPPRAGRTDSGLRARKADTERPLCGAIQRYPTDDAVMARRFR